MVHGLLARAAGGMRNLRYGFLLLPLTVAVGLGVAAVALVAVDRSAGTTGVDFGFSSGPEAGRSLLSTIAASLITVAGVTFSIMIVTLQLVSQQFSPRALRTFLGDRLNQFVAGYFIGVFVYCLLVLRTVENGGATSDVFVPSLSITVAILLALGALALLLVFIDHMAGRIQVSTIAANVAQETLSALGQLYPEPFGSEADDRWEAELAAWRQRGEPERTFPPRPGYVQTALIDDIPEAEGSTGLRIHVPVAPGDFVTERQPVAEVWHGDHDGEVGAALARAIVVGDERDISQDVGYGIRQLADITKRAISPSINDPTTAWTCIRYIGAILERLAGRDLPSPLRRYADGRIEVIARRAGWEEYVDAGLLQVGRYARDPRVAGALVEVALGAAAAARAAGAPARLPAIAGLADVLEAVVEPAGPVDTRQLGELIARLRDA